MANNTDLLLKYTAAYDAGDFDTLGEILAATEENESLATAILALHLRFDSNEEFTAQLQGAREPLKGGCHYGE